MIGLGLGLKTGATLPLAASAIGRAQAIGGTVYDFTSNAALRSSIDGEATIGRPANAGTVGLFFDRAGGPAGVERIVNGDFAENVSGWTAVATAGAPPTLERKVYPNPDPDGDPLTRMRVTASADGTFQRVPQTVTGLTVGHWYRVRCIITDKSGDFSIRIRLASGANPADVTTEAGELEFYFQAVSTSQQLYPIMSATVAGGDWFEIDDFSCREIPGNHARAPAIENAGTWTNGGLTVDGVNDHYVTSIPSTMAYFMAKLSISAASTNVAPLFCAEVADAMFFRRAGTAEQYRDGAAGNAKDFVFPDGPVRVNGVVGNAFTYNVAHVVEAAAGSTSTKAAITRLFGNVTAAAFLSASVKAMVFLPAAPSASDLATFRAWLNSL